MQASLYSFSPSKKLIATGLVLLSLLMAAYAPMASISSAQSAIDASKLEALRTKVVDSITKRLASFQSTLSSMNIDVAVSENGASFSVGGSKSPSPGTSASPSTSPSAGASFSIGENGLDVKVNFPGEIKNKVKEFLQKIVEELTQLKTKATNANSLTSMQSIAGNLDAQSGLNQLANVQAAVTQSIQSLTGMFSNLQTTGNNLQGQITQLTDCVSSVSNANLDDCKGLNTTNADVTKSAQSQLDNIGTIMTTISSVLMSAITLLTALLSTFTGMAGGLGGLGSLGNISNLSNLTNLGDISSLTGSLGGVSGLLTSFTGLASQLDIANGMGGDASGLLGSLSGLINL